MAKSTRPETHPQSSRSRALRQNTNARQHGLAVPIGRDQELSAEVRRLATIIAAGNPELFDLAVPVAEAQLELTRIRHWRDHVSRSEATRDAALATDRYERRALSRRKFAIRRFDDARLSAAAAAEDPRPMVLSAFNKSVRSPK